MPRMTFDASLHAFQKEDRDPSLTVQYECQRLALLGGLLLLVADAVRAAALAELPTVRLGLSRRQGDQCALARAFTFFRKIFEAELASVRYI
jgi:hypothetical protein